VPKVREMAENKKVRAHEERFDLRQFVRTQLDPLSKMFASLPIAQLRVRTPQGSVLLVKAGRTDTARPALEGSGDVRASEGAKPAPRHAPLVPAQNGEAGRTYITINSEVVGIFRDAAQPPAVGESLRSGQVLGYLEALRLRNEIRCPSDAVLVAQVVEDGQPVDFGEALFVVDATGTAVAAAADAPAQSSAEPAPPEGAEPPRM
jgi:acetyl-CoA carboxylase biotin carboxyl carrier protein